MTWDWGGIMTTEVGRYNDLGLGRYNDHGGAAVH